MEFNRDFFCEQIFSSKLNNFDDLALTLFNHQLQHNTVLQNYCVLSGRAAQAHNMSELVFLPVEFFKTHIIKTGGFKEDVVFTSSATTGTIPSQHFVKDVSVYIKSYETAFRYFYGDINQYCVLALLPSYLERKGSSLVMMAEEMIAASQHPLSGFYLYDFEKLYDTLIRLKAQQQPAILLGVTFALLDFIDTFPFNFPELIIMETGGMKGKRKELTREEVHRLIKQGTGVIHVHAEYGMTELLSQAYAKVEGRFISPPWMKVVITDTNDPFTILPHGKTGIINVIDLANMDSCAFIKTSDIGKINNDGTFEVLGRMDNSDVRGCSLMYL